VSLESEIRTLGIGKGEILRSGKDVAIVSIGNTVIPALRAAEDLSQLGIDAAVANARFVKPLDGELLATLCAQASRLITVEDHVLQGGFGSAVLEFLEDAGLNRVAVKRLGVPDRFIEHGTQDQLRRICGIDQETIAQAAIQMVRGEKKRKKEEWGRESA
jgi:1-deoxy-D-xylulose-5-phosphate synthase